jgi:hypothetical protein
MPHPLAVLRIRIRMNPHGFGLLDPHPESAFLRKNSADDKKKIKIFKHFVGLL